MPTVDDQGNIIIDIDKPQIAVPLKKKSNNSVAAYRVFITEALEDQIEELEQRIEQFLNSVPKKELVQFSFSSLGIKHFAVLIYKEVK